MPKVTLIPNHPGLYNLAFGEDLNIQATAEWWDMVDAAVRAGIIAAQTRAAAL